MIADTGAGQPVAGVAVETTRSGQVRLAVLQAPRRPYPTGQQEPCTGCAAAGVPKLGVSRAGPGSPALCWSCWGREQRRQAREHTRRQVARGWEEVGAAEAAAVCPVCGPGRDGGPPDVTELLPGPALARRDARRARRAPTRSGCWWCGDRSWLENARWRFAQDQAAAAAAEAARVDAEFERIAAVSEAEDRIADLTKWIERIRDALTRYRERRGGRAVEHTADALARLAAARTSSRGRPSVVPPLVAGVLSVDACFRSGRRALPGRERTAWLVGYSDRAVYDACQLLTGETVGWARRTRVGGRNSLQRRIDTGRWNDRGEFDLQPLPHSPIDPATRAAYLPEALGLLGQLAEYAQQLLDAAHAELDGLYAPTGQAPDWGEQARRAQFRQATRRVLAATATPDAAAKIAQNICRPHLVTIGECVNSCLVWGLRFSRPTTIHSRQCRAGQPAYGRRMDGASRSSTRGGSADLERYGPSPARPISPSTNRPRTLYVLQSTSRPSHTRVRPAWADWAYDLAQGLIPHLAWLDGIRLPAVAATLGARLGPDWTAAAVLAWLAEARTRPLLDDPDDPLAYLAAVLDQARAYTEHRHRLAAEAADARRAEQARMRAALDERDQAAVHGEARTAHAELAALRARLPGRLRGADHIEPADRLDDAGGAGPGEAWPTTAQSGGGLPTGWRHGDDRRDAGGADSGESGRGAPAAPRRRTQVRPRRHKCL